MADGIISGNQTVSNNNEITLELLIEWNSAGTYHIVAQYDTTPQITQTSPSFIFQSLAPTSNPIQWKITYKATGLQFSTTYYIKADMIRDSDGTILNTYTGSIGTTGQRLSLSLNIIDKNNINIVVDVTPVQGDPQMVPEVHYIDNGNASRTDPQPVFDGQTSNPPTYTYVFKALTLLYDTLYNVGVWLVEYGNPSNVIEFDSDTIFTDREGSTIDSVTINVKDKKATITARVTFGTNDDHAIKIIYSKNQGLSPATTKYLQVLQQVSNHTYDFFTVLTKLHQNTLYYYDLQLWNTTTNQYIAHKTGTFKTLKGGFPLWMYLHYFV